jgi:hypothetical protein
MRAVAFLAALAVAVGVFFLLRPSNPAPAPEAEPPDAEAPAGAPPPAATGRAGLERSAPTTPRPPRNLPREPATARYDTGSVAVRLVPQEGLAVAPSVRIAIEALGPDLPAGVVFAPRPDGLYAASGIPTGTHRVRVFSEGSVDASADVEVTKDAETVVEVALAPGGVAAYDVSLPSGEKPETVTLELTDVRGHAIPAVFQTPQTTLRIVPEKPVAVPPTGKVLGLKPGKYVLKAKSPAGETAEQAFTAKTGETTELTLQVRR